jgi:hypothetical protein
MHHGDPALCRLLVRHTDGTVHARDWTPDEWPPQIGQAVEEDGRSYRIAAVRRDGDVTVAVALPARLAVRRV